MRVAVLGQSGMYAPPALRRLVDAQGFFEIVLVVEGRKSPLYGCENRLFDPAPRRVPAGKECDLATLATASGIATLITSNINSVGAVSILQRFNLDWIVCIGFDRLFSMDVVRTARVGAINAHPSLLPQWRGPSPLFWIVKSGTRESGVTLHALDEREDGGVIYAQKRFEMPHRATGGQLYGLAGDLAGRMLGPLLTQSARIPPIGVVQGRSSTHRARRPCADDAVIEPLDWACEHLVDFACAAPAFSVPTMRIGEYVLGVRSGLLAEPGRSLGTSHFWKDGVLQVACKDGVAHLEVRASDVRISYERAPIRADIHTSPQ